MTLANLLAVLFLSAFFCFLSAAVGKYAPLVGWVGGILLAIAGLPSVLVR